MGSSLKHKLSVTLDEELVKKIFSALSTGKYRNKSHVVEYAVQKLLENENTLKKIDGLKSQTPVSEISSKSEGDLDG